jgi:hypothetical protein
MRTLLIASGKTEEEADALVREAARQSGGNAWEGIEKGLRSIRGLAGPHNWRAQRRTVEYVFVRDEPNMGSVSLDQLIAEAGSRDETDTVSRLTAEREMARQIGLVNLRIIQALPVLLAGIGYTRYRSMPGDANDQDAGSVADPTRLRPYAEQDGKIPIYVARNTTEAILYELDPWRLAAFLATNSTTKIPDSATVSTPALRAWLLGLLGQLVTNGEAHLLLTRFERERGAVLDEVAALAFGALHTISHTLKATAHRYVGVDADALAEYLFPAHSIGMLYVSSQVEFTLGGVDAVFRANLTQWLGSARDFAGTCSFDPVCARTGGACLACLYPKFGCVHFNRTVSRAFLMGGNVPGREAALEGFWSTRVIDTASRLQERTTGAR